VIFHIHGFGDYCSRVSHFALELAEQGYDFFTMDSRGHGNSQGACILVQSVDRLIEDHFTFHIKVLDKFYSKEQGFEQPPNCFLIGHSFGC
jgi:alpha-beta hydrolase superfamily lysophospholipase